jgi:hypothetical protein
MVPNAGKMAVGVSAGHATPEKSVRKTGSVFPMAVFPIAETRIVAPTGVEIFVVSAKWRKPAQAKASVKSNAPRTALEKSAEMMDAEAPAARVNSNKTAFQDPVKMDNVSPIVREKNVEMMAVEASVEHALLG